MDLYMAFMPSEYEDVGMAIPHIVLNHNVRKAVHHHWQYSLLCISASTHIKEVWEYNPHKGGLRVQQLRAAKLMSTESIRARDFLLQSTLEGEYFHFSFLYIITIITNIFRCASTLLKWSQLRNTLPSYVYAVCSYEECWIRCMVFQNVSCVFYGIICSTKHWLSTLFSLSKPNG